MAYMKAYAVKPDDVQIDLAFIRKYGKRFSATAIGTKKWAGEAVEVCAREDTTAGVGTLIFLPGVRLSESGV